FSMMTGRFPHELIAHWQDALDDTHPTLAEVLGAAGYVSGGFVANMEYAGYESGLHRGFVNFEDYPVSAAELALSSSLAHAVINNQALRNLTGEHQILGRKLAEDVNRNFLDWLSRQDPERPFFAFLNYFDAHSIYLPPDPWDAEFGSEAERDMTGTWHFKRRARHRLKDRTATPAQIQVELDSYDGSIAYVDHEVGRLLDELERRRILDDTIVVVTADHGEHFGEHDRFGHDNSLYRQLVQVPLVIRFPARAPAGAIVSEPVSLRDLPATLLDLAGLGRGGIGGASLASLWGETVPAETSRTIMSEWAAGSLTPRGLEANPGRLEHALDFLRVKLGMEAAEKRELEVLMKSLVADDHHYIRNGDGTEELYHFGSDPAEVQDLARSGQADTHLVRFRTSLRRILAPHLPSTSNPEVSFR
ncbi:MAG TPA: sulfatase-like hydrolase/transferase, partial [Gemmatimonadota bacterium]